MTTELQYLDKNIGEVLLEENRKKESEHTSSGKLSASMLGTPLQWQILRIIGVPQSPFDEYTLRKFQRGKDVEDWVVSKMVGLVDKQKFVEYKETIGFIDCTVDMSKWNLDLGVIPHEVKSVTNLKFKRIEKGGADKQHVLQACLYALAEGSKHFAIDYIASDDYRIKTYLFETADFKKEIDEIIFKFMDQIKKKRVPEFEPVFTWQTSLEYNHYPRFADMLEDGIEEVLKIEYPQAYRKLKGINGKSNN